MSAEINVIERRFAKLIEESQGEYEELLGERALCWLALLPEWTLPLAEACEFPLQGMTFGQLVAEVERAGLCDVRRDTDGIDDETVRFWMRARTRTGLFERWQRGVGPDLATEITAIAPRIREIHQEGEVEVSPGVRRWAELALAELSETMVAGDALMKRVRDALATDKASAAGEWVFAADSLAPALGAELRAASDRARRAISRHYRHVQDERYVAEFVKREGQLREIRKLPKEHKLWAVHFIGQSGVGKTMLMRYLTSDLPGASPFGSSARIDFDYIDPRFPLEAPAQLLHELGEELAAGATTAEQDAAYRTFREAVIRTEAVDRDPADEDPLETYEFAEALATFIAFVRSIPQPVLLIIDTCEELAKLYPAGEDLPSVRAMFEILTRLHDAIPTLRVVLAGRRWLTRRAANKMRGVAVPPAVEKMEPRPFMQMYPMRGFTEDEVVTYLRDSRKLAVDDEMIAAILRLTEDPGSPAGMDPEQEGPAEGRRFSPSDVALFAGWIAREPDLSPRDLSESNHDPYVEVRIFQRIESQELMAAIPAAVLLERFDAGTIGPALEGGAHARSRAIEGLIEQEWTHLEEGVGTDDIVISIDGGLLKRLRRYYGSDPERKRLLSEAAERLVPHLVEMFSRPTSEVPPDRIDSAVRALAVPRTVPLLDQMAAQVVREPAWPWAEEVCRFLLSSEREPPLPAPLRPSARALYAAALTHRRATAGLVASWAAVTEEAKHHPDKGHRETLRIRGRLGGLAAKARHGSYEQREAERILLSARRTLHRRALADRVGGGLLATIEAIVDSREERNHWMPVEAVGLCLSSLLEWSKGNDPVWTYVLILEGRMHALTGNWAAAREAFDRVEEAREESGELRRPRCADWVPPTSIHHRALLELLRFRLADRRETASLLLRCERAAIEGDGGVDGAQLLSLALQARLARGDLPTERLGAVARAEATVTRGRLTAPAHAVAPPLFVSLAEVLVAVGRPGQALELVYDREQAAAARRTDEGSVAAAARASVRLSRTLRLRQRLGLIGGFASAPDPDLRSEALAAGALIAGMRPPPSAVISGDHVSWRACNLLDPRADEEALRTRRKAKPKKARDEESLHRDLDILEANMVQTRWSGIRGPRLLRAVRATRRRDWIAGNATSISDPLGFETMRLALRRRALVDLEDGPAGSPRTRQIGRLALEEGEVLALRLPHRAIALLEFAEFCLDDVNDRQGVFFAALTSAIAEIHAGKDQEALARCEHVVRTYDKLRESLPELPGAERLVDRDAGLDDGGDDAWYGWKLRLATYLNWCRDAKPSLNPPPTLQSEPELALEPAVGAPGTKVPSGVLQNSRRFPWLLSVLGLLVAFMVVAVVGGLLRHNSLYLLLLVPLAAVITGLVERLARSVPFAVLPVDGFDVTISRSPLWPARRAAKARIDPWARHWYVRRYFRFWRRTRPSSRWETLITPPKGDALDRLPSPLYLATRPTLRRRRDGSGRAFRPIGLIVSPDLAPLGWEWRLLGPQLADRGWNPHAVSPLWRVRPSGPRPVLRELPPPVLAPVCSSQWLPFVYRHAEPRVDLRSAGRGEVARAAVTIGFPVFTRAGWRLQLDDEPTGGETRPSIGRQRLLSPDRLVSRAPIAIVVARPGGEKLGPDRTTDRLRGFANEAFLAGAYAVIAVPCLPSERTAAALRMLTAAIADLEEIPSAESLHLLVRRVRGLICSPTVAGWEGDLSHLERPRWNPRLARVALDLCLFGPH